MTDFPDHYAALGIDPTADQEVIAAAYRALAKKYHPDTGATTGTASPQRFAEIQQAYEVLGSVEGRRRYDQALLEATQRELDEHLAAKQRKLAGTVGVPPPPPPDLGVIRPERRARGQAFRKKATLRNLGPFLVVSALFLAVAGGFAYLFLGTTPPPLVEPPLPGAVPQQQAAAPPAPAAQPPQEPEEKPLFGTSMMDQPAAPPAPPVEEALVEEPAPAPAPIPKARPAAETATSLPAETQQSQPAKAPVQARATRYSVVIYERSRNGEMVTDRAGLLFASEDRCNSFGEESVLRRLAPYEGLRNRPRIWYACEEEP
jgi:hypothetical protein